MADQLPLFPLPVPAPEALLPVVVTPVLSGEVIDPAAGLPAVENEEFTRAHASFPVQVPVDVIGRLRSVTVSETGWFSSVVVMVMAGQVEHRILVWTSSRVARGLLRRLGRRVRVTGICTIDAPDSRSHTVDPGKVTKPKARSRRG